MWRLYNGVSTDDRPALQPYGGWVKHFSSPPLCHARSTGGCYLSTRKTRRLQAAVAITAGIVVALAGKAGKGGGRP